MRVVVLIIFLFMVKVTHAQTNSIEGNWLTSDGGRKIAVYKKDEK